MLIEIFHDTDLFAYFGQGSKDNSSLVYFSIFKSELENLNIFGTLEIRIHTIEGTESTTILEE